MNAQNSLFTSATYVLFIVNFFIIPESSAAGLLNDVTGENGLLSGVLGGGTGSNNGLLSGLTSGNGGLLSGVLGSNGLVGNLLGGGSQTTSSCSKSAGSTTGSATNTTSQELSCPLISVNVLISSMMQKCRNTKSAQTCMQLICVGQCQLTCQTSLLEVCIQLILDLELLGLITVQVNSNRPSSSDPTMGSLISVLASLNINLRL